MRTDNYATSSNQRLEQCFHMGTLPVWSTLVAFKWLNRKLSLYVVCQIMI